MDAEKYPELVLSIVRDLERMADSRTRDMARSFFKEHVIYHGVKTAAVNKMAGEVFRQIRQLSKFEIFSLAEDLLKTDFNEEAFIACDWIYRMRDQYQPADFARFERWIDLYVNNWAKCDTLCNHSVGAFLEKYPEYLLRLHSWACSDNRWMRRAAAVSLILPVRNGNYLETVLTLSDILLNDPEDLVQKGYGWLLKEASKTHQQEVFDYIIRNKAAMPRTALRYAIEKMPDDLRREAMIPGT